MREYLDKVIKADQCAKYVDDIGIAVSDADHFIANLRATFKCIQEAGLKLTMHLTNVATRSYNSTPIPNIPIALKADAMFGAAGYAVLIEDDPSQKFVSPRKLYAPVAYGSKTFTPVQIRMSIYAKEFLAIYFAFKEFRLFSGARLDRSSSSLTIES